MPTYTSPTGQTTSVSDAQLAANPTYWNGILSTGNFTKTSDVAQYSPTPSVITSDGARATTQTNLDELNATTARPVGPMEGDSVNKAGGVSAYKMSTTGTGATDTTADGTKTSTTTGMTPEQKALKDAADAEVTGMQNDISTLEQYRTERDALNDQMISSIQAKYANLQRAQQQVNAQEEALVRIGGLRSGRDRYAGEIQAGILSAARSAGIARLSDLAAEEQTLIIKAKMAASDEDFKMLDTIMKRRDDLRKTKLDTLTEIMKNNVELEKLASQRAKDAASALKDQMTSNREMQKFALDNNIFQPFYEIGGVVFSSKTGMPVNDEETYTSLGGKGDGTDIQQVSGEYADDKAFVLDLRKQYPDAGISLTDDPAEAAAKLAASRIYQDKVRGPVGNGPSSVSNPAWFSSGKVEQDFREDVAAKQDAIDAGTITVDQAYRSLRTVYRPDEVDDDAINSFLGITPAGESISSEQPPTTSPSMNPVEQILYGGNPLPSSSETEIQKMLREQALQNFNK